jgi:hypothetical protein
MIYLADRQKTNIYISSIYCWSSALASTWNCAPASCCTAASCDAAGARPMEAEMAVTAVIMSSTLPSLLTIDPTPTPFAPHESARGAVTSVSPEAHMTGMDTALGVEDGVEWLEEGIGQVTVCQKYEY